MKKLIVCTLSILLALVSFAACGSQNPDPTGTQSQTADSQTQPSEPQVVTYWYFHTGDEAAVQEEAIAAYNASQGQYKVEG